MCDILLKLTKLNTILAVCQVSVRWYSGYFVRLSYFSISSVNLFPCVCCVCVCCAAVQLMLVLDSTAYFIRKTVWENEEGLIERERDGESERACFLRSAGKKLKLPRGRIMQPYASAGRRSLFIFLRFYVKSLCLKKIIYTARPWREHCVIKLAKIFGQFFFALK